MSRRSSLLRVFLALGFLAALCTPAPAFLTSGRVWPAGDIVMQLQLGAPAAVLSDGSLGWNDVAESALQDWNTQIARSRLTAAKDSIAAKAQGNRLNNVFFSPDVYGSAWGSGVLAITITFRNTRNTTEADVLFNSNRTWDSYRGALRRTNVMDFRRVALHEFGHVLGLNHPDEAVPAQSVAAVMNSTISNIEALQLDDITGARSLYDTAASLNAPSIVAQPTSASLQTTGRYTLNVGAVGPEPLAYAWTFRPAGSTTTEPFRFATGPTYTIGSVQPADSGSYAVTVTNPFGSVTSNVATINVAPLPTVPDTLLANISTRGNVGPAAGVLIAGLVIGGSSPKNVIVRAVGPTLSGYGVAGFLEDPALSIIDSAGRVVAENDNWGGATNSAQFPAGFSRLGAFQFPTGSRDAALMVTLAPGTYTARVSGVGDSTGVALVEAYDADADAATSRSRRLANISTRGQVGSGENALIAGLVVAGPGPHTYLIRAAGPTLSGYGVPGALSDPLLQIYQNETLLRENDDWDTPTAVQPALRDAATAVGAFQLGSRRESAMLITLQPGAYTAKVTGFGGGVGIGLIEIYEIAN